MIRTIRKPLILLLAIVAASLSTFGAVGKYSIKGRVIDINTKKPVEYASVVLIALPDSSIKKSGLTNPQGLYEFSNVTEGSYVVKAQIVGYEANVSEKFVSTPNTSVKDIVIAPSAAIKEVTVTGKKPYIEKKADRTVLNIESSATASAESAYEVLKKAPNISIDKDDNININGKQGVTVMINDRPTHLSGNDLANYLRGVQGSEIEKVEIINNPPSRYDAAGNTGIINIKTKRNFKPGFNGTLNGGITYNGNVGGSGGINLNVRNKKTNVYASYTPGVHPGKNQIDLVRKLQSNGKELLFDQSTKGDFKHKASSFKAGVDYDINKKNTIGLMVSGYDNSRFRGVKGNTYFYSDKTTPDSSLYSENSNDDTYRNMSYNLNYKSVLDTSGRELNVDVDFAKFNNGGDAYNDTYYFNALREEVKTPQHLYSDSPSDITIQSAKTDYVHPIGKEIKIEAGAKASKVETDNNLKCYFVRDGGLAPDASRSNHFVYDESILAGYLSLGYDHKGTSIKGGLRVEHTSSNGNSITMNKVVDRSYVDFFPTFFIQQKLNENNSIGLNYNRRIDRPQYQRLNPFRFYIDEYSFVEGNPFLRPQYTHNLSASYSWKNMVFSELTYTHTNDIMLEVIEQDNATKSFKQIPRNLSSLDAFAFTNSINLSPVKWWKSNNNITATYNSFKNTNNSLNQENSKLSANIRSNNSFILPKKYTFEVMAMYQSPQVYGMFDSKSIWMVNLGIQKSFLENRARIKVSLDDLFKTYEFRSTINRDNLNFRTHNTFSSRRLGITFTYRFGKNDLKPSRQRRTGLEDESERIGSGR